MSPEIATLVSTAVGLIFGSVITYWGSVKLSKRQARSQAAMRFISSFTPEIAALSNFSSSSTDQSTVIQSAEKKHLTSFIEFRSYLSETDALRLDKLWGEYYGYEGDKDKPYLEQYSGYTDTQKAKENRELAIHRLQSLVSFAEEKL